MQFAHIGVHFEVKAFPILQAGFNRPLIIDCFCAR